MKRSRHSLDSVRVLVICFPPNGLVPGGSLLWPVEYGDCQAVAVVSGRSDSKTETSEFLGSG
jgi:hypothetical protein